MDVNELSSQLLERKFLASLRVLNIKLCFVDSVSIIENKYLDIKKIRYYSFWSITWFSCFM